MLIKIQIIMSIINTTTKKKKCIWNAFYIRSTNLQLQATTKSNTIRQQMKGKREKKINKTSQQIKSDKISQEKLFFFSKKGFECIHHLWSPEVVREGIPQTGSSTLQVLATHAGGKQRNWPDRVRAELCRFRSFGGVSWGYVV